jgi:hypothetical protein
MRRKKIHFDLYFWHLCEISPKKEKNTKNSLKCLVTGGGVIICLITHNKISFYIF